MSGSLFLDLAAVFAPNETATPKPSPRGAARAVDEGELLADLNEPQRGAVVHAGSPVLVVAGAGSGKTKVLIRRVAHLVGVRGIRPGAVLATIFTNKAVAGIWDWVAGLVGSQARIMWVSTSHLACMHVLRPEIDRLGIVRPFSIYSDTDAERLVSLVMQDQGLGPKRFPVRAVINAINGWKDDLVDFETTREQASGPTGKANAEVYENYQARLRAANALDFDDLVVIIVNLFQAFPEIREKYRRRFRHVLVDKYQNINHAQYALIHEFCGQAILSTTEAPTVEPVKPMVAGNSGQSIYTFRGTTVRNILSFENDSPGVETIVLDQNCRSTNTMFQAANAVIARNRERHDKALWNDLGDGTSIVGWVADIKHDEAQFVVREVDRFVDDGRVRYGDIAVFYRTNAQFRALEEVFIRVGMPYRVVGGVWFYERREIRDAIAYLWAIANPADDVSVRQILNAPKRDIGDRAVAMISLLADAERIYSFEALSRSEEAPGPAIRLAKQIHGFMDLIKRHRVKMAQDDPADGIPTSALTDSGYLAELQNSTDPQGEIRLKNLEELINIAVGFVAAVNVVDPDEENESGLAVRIPEPDASSPALLERVALVADSDQVSDEEQGQGVVTLMIPHTVEGLEFDTVFLTGMEEGVFPHLRAMELQDELEEEYRLVYAGITRARELLHLSHTMMRVAFGQPNHNPTSRSLEGIPEGLMDWHRLGEASITWATGNAERRPHTRNALSLGRGSGKCPTVSDFTIGDCVAHTAFRPGAVLAVHGTGPRQQVDVDFGSTGKRRLTISHTPVEKLQATESRLRMVSGASI